MKKTPQTRKMIQVDMFPKESAAYGGVLRNTRKGRSGGRKLSTQHSMHIVLRSSKAKGPWSFQTQKNKLAIEKTVHKHAKNNFIAVFSLANVGNHLHLHIKITHRVGFKAFIRAITGAIAIIVTGASKNNSIVKSAKDRFWDYRPFSKIVMSFKHLLHMRDYMKINIFEGLGAHRTNARLWVARQKDLLEHGPWPDLKGQV